MSPPELLFSVCWASMVQRGRSLGKRFSGECPLMLVGCRVKRSQPALERKEKEPKEQPRGEERCLIVPSLCCLRTKGRPVLGRLKARFWRNTNCKRSRRWKHRKVRAGRCLGAPNTRVGVLAWVAGRKPGKQLWPEGQAGRQSFLFY